MTLLALVPLGLLVALGLKVAHDKREHDRALRRERQRFIDCTDEYLEAWDAWNRRRVSDGEAVEAIEEWLRP